jgi:glycosyltransferase involved in cell wall biosynthesis
MENPQKDVTVTPFGVDVNQFKKDENRKYNERPVIGIIKYLKPIYNIPLLIKAFAIVKEKATIKPLLHIYGSGPLKDELVSLTRELGIYDDVIFFETIPNIEVPKALNTMDIFVNSSNVESFGVNIVEAMACGLPVVATPCPGPKEVIDNGVTGVVLKDWDYEELAEELIKLVESKTLREQYGKAGREKVLREYDWSKNVETLIKVYNQVARESV